MERCSHDFSKCKKQQRNATISRHLTHHHGDYWQQECERLEQGETEIQRESVWVYDTEESERESTCAHQYIHIHTYLQSHTFTHTHTHIGARHQARGVGKGKGKEEAERNEESEESDVDRGAVKESGTRASRSSKRTRQPAPSDAPLHPPPPSSALVKKGEGAGAISLADFNTAFKSAKETGWLKRLATGVRFRVFCIHTCLRDCTWCVCEHAYKCICVSNCIFICIRVCVYTHTRLNDFPHNTLCLCACDLFWQGGLPQDPKSP